MKFSIIIATYNRCESLKDTLDSLLAQEYNTSFNYEIIVVDNNSKDKTEEVVESYSSKFYGKLRYLFESRQGKSNALNLGIREASGEIIAFTDDDVIVDKQWLFHINNAFNSYNCNGLAGKVLPCWKALPPGWLTRKFWVYLAIQDYGDEPFYLPKKGLEFNGSNFVFKKYLFKEFGLFNTLLNRSQDTDIVRRFINEGSKLLYYPKIVVFHVINKERLNKQYFKKWNFHMAQNDYLMKNGYLFLKLFLELMNRFISYMWCFLKQDRENSFYHELKFFYYLGLIKAKLRNARTIKKYAKS